jgi:uncharacterized protein (TIGR02453 family)
MASSSYFSIGAFEFLAELAENNDREWFNANRRWYEEEVRGPALRLIADIAPLLGKLSPHFEAGPKSLFRIHRDTRFSPDKRPYKTHVGIHFRYGGAPNPHVPGYYLHIQPNEVFTGFGVWHPDADTLRAIRDAIVDRPQAWKKASRDPALTEAFELEGALLSRPPRGYPADHPLVEDLKRKDFVAIKRLDESFVLEPDLPQRLADLWAVGSRFMRFLCEANGLPFLSS